VKVEQYEALDEEEREELCDLARREGKTVFSKDYDSGAPGGGGDDSVVRYRGLFFVVSLDDHPPGPFASLRQAIEDGLLTDVTSAVGEIVCEGMPVARLLPMLTVHESPVTNLVNDEPWRFDRKNGWRQAEDGGGPDADDGEYEEAD
jgi:hypothetical protein